MGSNDIWHNTSIFSYLYSDDGKHSFRFSAALLFSPQGAQETLTGPHGRVGKWKKKKKTEKKLF